MYTATVFWYLFVGVFAGVAYLTYPRTRGRQNAALAVILMFSWPIAAMGIAGWAIWKFSPKMVARVHKDALLLLSGRQRIKLDAPKNVGPAHPLRSPRETGIYD